MLNMSPAEIKEKIAEAKSKVSELDVKMSELRGIPYKFELGDRHLPVEGQPFIYLFRDPEDNQRGIRIPAGQTGFFSGILNVDSDSTFECTDIQGVQQLFWQDAAGRALDPPAGTYWAPLAKSDLGFRYFQPTLAGQPITTLWGVDFGFRLTDGGTGRRLDQAQDTNNAELYIPGKFLGSGMPYSDLGPNYTSPLAFDHTFAKNTAISCDLNVVSPFVDELRIWIGLIGYKVYGD